MQSKSAVKATNLIFQELSPCKTRLEMRSHVPGTGTVGMLHKPPSFRCWLRVVRGAQAVAGDTGREKVPILMLMHRQKHEWVAKLKQCAEDLAGTNMMQRLEMSSWGGPKPCAPHCTPGVWTKPSKDWNGLCRVPADPEISRKSWPKEEAMSGLISVWKWGLHCSGAEAVSLS